MLILPLRSSAVLLCDDTCNSVTLFHTSNQHAAAIDDDPL
jgi:hypothetical protein